MSDSVDAVLDVSERSGRMGNIKAVSDRPFISVDELELMSPNERLAAVRDRVVTNLDELPDDFRSRIIATAQSLSDSPLAD